MGITPSPMPISEEEKTNARKLSLVSCNCCNLRVEEKKENHMVDKLGKNE
jgi:hypothetical protein